LYKTIDGDANPDRRAAIDAERAGVEIDRDVVQFCAVCIGDGNRGGAGEIQRVRTEQARFPALKCARGRYGHIGVVHRVECE
jgi:hypothetical protein